MSKYGVIKAAFEVLSRSGVSGLVRALSQSRGVIFTLHRVLPGPPPAFSPNGILQVTPDFLDAVITRVRALGIDIVSLDEALDRLAAPKSGRKFVVLTFDDGYRDNLTDALPILRRHKAPFTLYVPTGLVDARGEIWWQALEDIIAAHDSVEAEGTRHDTSSLAAKQLAFDTIYWRMRKMPEPERLALVRDLCARYGIDPAKHCRDLIMDWDELKTFAADPLCTIGAHTVHHYELKKLSDADARDEIAGSIDILAEKFGRRPEHFSYPLGGPLSAGPRDYDIARALGLKSAVTTVPGGLYPQADRLALPRVSLNGLFQQKRYIDVFATGAIFSALGKFTG